MNNKKFEDDLAKWLSENLKLKTPEELEEEKRKEELQKRYMQGVEKRFLTYARSLPGREYETINDPLVEIIGDIENGKVINLRVLPESKAFSESLKYVFSDENKHHFSINKSGQIDVVSDELPDEIIQIINFIITPDNDDEKEVFDGEINIKLL